MDTPFLSLVTASSPDPGLPSVATMRGTLQRIAEIVASPIIVLMRINGEDIEPVCAHGIDMPALQKGAALRNFLLSRMATRLVNNALVDARLSSDPLVINPPYVRAGVFTPIAIGTRQNAYALCALSPVPSAFGRRTLVQLDTLASLLVPLISRKSAPHEAAEAEAEADPDADRATHLLAEKASGIGSWHIDLEAQSTALSAEAARILGLKAGATLPVRSLLRRCSPESRRMLLAAARNTLHGNVPFDAEARLMSSGQGARPLRLIGNIVADPHCGRRIAGMVFDPLRHAYHAVQSCHEQRDALTGLDNREAFDRALGTALANTNALPVTVALMDLDGFKQVNDSFGHILGDKVLVAISERLRRESDKLAGIARWGGDEFALLFPLDTPLADARLLMCELVDDLSNLSVHERDTLPLGASCGIVQVNVPVTIEETMSRADLALYDAKAAGRGRVSVWVEEMSAMHTARQTSVIQLKAAIRDARTFPVYQPIVALADGRVAALEALLRVDDGSGGIVEARHVHPADFNRHLAHAVSTKMIDDIAAEYETLRALFGHDCEIAINLSEADLRPCDLDAVLSAAVKRSSLENRNLCLEVSERVLLKDYTGSARKILRHLDALGFLISLDDFGTGSCSLTQLRDFPISKVKIDHSLISRLGVDHQSRVMTAAIVQMSHSLGLEVVAEGVEGEDQEQILRSIGCDYVQGYRFGRPATITQLRTDFVCASSAMRAEAKKNQAG